MRIAGNLARAAAVLILLAALVLIIAAGLFLAIPEIEVPAAGLKWILARVLPHGSEVQIGEGNLRLTRPRGMPLSKDIRIELRDVCVAPESPAARACFAKVDLALLAGWGGPLIEGERRWKPHLIAIKRFLFLGGDVTVDLAKAPRAPPQPKVAAQPGLELNSRLAKINGRVADFSRYVLPKWRVNESLIELESVRVVASGKKSYSARATLKPEGADGRAFTGLIENLRESGGPLRAGVAAHLAFPAAGTWTWVFSMESRLSFGAGRRAKLMARGRGAPGERLAGSVAGVFQGKFPLRHFEVNARYADMAFEGGLWLEALTGKNVMSRLYLNGCDWRLDFRRRGGHVVCGPRAAHLVLAEGRPGKGLGDPRLFTLSPQFDLRLARMDFGSAKAADLELDVLLDHMGLMVASAAMKGHFEERSGSALVYDIEGESRMEVARFSRIVRLLAGTPYAIPAPLNVLDGPLRLKADLKFANAGGEAAYRLTSGLEGKGQSVRLRLDGVTRLLRGPEKIRASRDGSRLEVDGGDRARPALGGRALRSATDATLSIDRLHLTAPRFDFGLPPRFTPDRRFGPMAREGSDSSTAPETGAMDVHLRIRTKDKRSILIASNLTRSPLPVGLELVYDESAGAAPTKLTGSVVIGETAISAFGRHALLEQFKIDLAPNGMNRMYGRARVADPQYDISIFLFGTTKEPVVRFASTPPLNDQQIIAVLLFGRPLNELTQEQKISTSNVEAAFADAALGLSSIYLLANTPVESVGYDMERGVASVNLGLGGGASIELGTGNRSNIIGFRKRLGHGFVFRSDVETLGSSGKRLISALVEWSKWF